MAESELKRSDDAVNFALSPIRPGDIMGAANAGLSDSAWLAIQSLSTASLNGQGS